MNKKNTQPQAETVKNSQFWHYAASSIGVLIIFGFGYLPPVEPITPMGMKILGIFLGMIFLWSFVGLLWPSLLGIVALMISGYAPPARILHMSFGDTVTVLIMFAVILFGAIQHSGVTRYISRWFLTRKIINGKPVVFSFVFIYTTYILAALTANILPALLFMWAILYSVLEDVGYKKGDKYTSIMVIGTMFGAISGQAAKPFTGSALMIVGAYEKVSQAPMDYLPYMAYGFIMSSIGIILFALLIKFVFRPDMSKIKDISVDRFKAEAYPPMNLHQKIMLFCLFGYLIMVLLPSILPRTLPGMPVLAKMGPLGVVIIFLVGLSVFKIDGKPIIKFNEIASKYMGWEIYILVSMAMAVSSAMTGEGTGITDFMENALNPILGGHSLFVFSLILAAFCVFISQFANNGVMGVLLMPVIQVFTEQAGGIFPAMATLAIFSLHLAIMTPAASPYAALLYGNRDWVCQKDILKYGLAICILGIFLYTVIGVPVMNMIF